MRMSMRLITLWYNFTDCVSHGAGLRMLNQPIP